MPDRGETITTTKTMKTKCQKCGNEFETEAMVIFDRETPLKRTCGDCAASAFESIAAESRAAEKAKLDASWHVLCPRLYLNTDIERLTAPYVADVLRWKFNPKGLMLHGPTGKAKTRTAYLLLKRLHYEGHSIAAFHSSEFAHQCARSFGDQTGEAWAERIVKADILFLDDLGKFRLTERVESELFGIVESRTAWERPIIITTNFVGGALESKMTEDRGVPMVRRLREFCTPIAFI